MGADKDYQKRFNNMKVLSNILDEEYYSVLSKAFCVLLSIKEANVGAGQITLIQAMQFGKPLIVTKADGLSKDYVVHGENGLIVEKDKEAVLQALEMLYVDDELYKKLTTNARKAYETYFSCYRMGAKLGEIVRELTEFS